jgi:hypothetical protein
MRDRGTAKNIQWRACGALLYSLNGQETGKKELTFRESCSFLYVYTKAPKT